MAYTPKTLGTRATFAVQARACLVLLILLLAGGILLSAGLSAQHSLLLEAFGR